MSPEQHEGRPADAERWYLRAQEIKDVISPQDASTLNNLANLYLALLAAIGHPQPRFGDDGITIIDPMNRENTFQRIYEQPL